jgi:hypothetical protein
MQTSRAAGPAAALLGIEIVTSPPPSPDETSRAGDTAAALLDLDTVTSPCQVLEIRAGLLIPLPPCSISTQSCSPAESLEDEPGCYHCLLARPRDSHFPTTESRRDEPVIRLPPCSISTQSRPFCQVLEIRAGLLMPLLPRLISRQSRPPCRVPICLSRRPENARVAADICYDSDELAAMWHGTVHS